MEPMQPLRLCLSHDNRRLFVTDMENHLVHVLNRADGTLIQTIGKGKGRGPGQFESPWGVCISGNGEELYVADNNNHRVQVFNAIDGSYVRLFGQGHLKYPRDLCLSLNGEELYVSAANNNGIQVLRVSDGSYLRTIGRKSEDPNEPDKLYNPDGLCLSLDGQLFVADRKKIVVFRATDGSHVRSIFVEVDNDEDAELSGICLSPNGDDLYVTDGLYNNVQVLRTEDGSLIQTIGEHGQTAGKFITPLGVCVSSDGELIVADTWNYRIQVFQM